VAAVQILIPAAGASLRMRGGDKLLERVDGLPLLVRQAARARATGCRVLVALPPDRPARAAALAGLGVETCVIADAAQGMAGSLRAGAAWAEGAALMVMLPDMPEIDTAHLLVLMRAFAEDEGRVVRAASADLRPGHPVIFPATMLPLFAKLRGDQGARAVLERAAHPPVLVPLPADVALRDLDTPEDWALWRAGQEKPPGD